MPNLETWDLWYPKAAATGLPFARGRLDPTDTLLVHALPDYVTVAVSDDASLRLAFTADLPRTLQSPVCRLRREGTVITREDIWPTGADLGLPILLAGGEVGILKSWWHAGDKRAWRWQIELYNSLD
jgi:hypothetical protein